jgi:cytochrome c oxidase assembly protein subunit 15
MRGLQRLAVEASGLQTLSDSAMTPWFSRPSVAAATRQNIWLHRYALLAAIATFPLLFVGGLVTSTGSALAVPDWPTTFGHHMFLYPWSRMVGGIFYEHSHRLLGALVGFLTMTLTLWLWFKDRRPLLRWLGSIALAAVIIQGALGGLRVVLLQQTLAIVHACLAQAFLALLVSITLLTSPAWKAEACDTPMGEGGQLRRLCLMTTAFIYLQVVFGAVLRHTGTRLDAHILFAALVTIHVTLLAVQIWRTHGQRRDLVRPMLWLSGLLMAQLSLGVGAYVMKFTAITAMVPPAVRVSLTTTHLAVGSLMLVTSLVLALRVSRLRLEATSIMAAKLMPEQVSP